MYQKLKLIIIGLDGATFKIIDSLTDEEIPFIKSIIKNGTRAVLKSTVPPVTAPAWTTAYTGVNPGKHGIFDFQRISDSGERILVNASNNEYAYLWEFLSGKSLLISMPVTYPPKETNGVLITGNPTPFNSIYTYPEKLKEKIEELGYLIEYRQLYDNKKHSLIKDGFNFLLQALESKFKVLPYLINGDDYELIYFVIPEIDMTCHIRWQQGGDNKDVITMYKETDKLLKQYFEKYVGKVPMVFLSDHGFSGYNYVIHLNEWLFTKGWMKYETQTTQSYDIRNQQRNLANFVNVNSLYKFLNKLNINDIALKKLLNKIKIKDLAKKLLPDSLIKSIPKSMISPDWNITKAYCFSYESMGININLKGREKDGIVPLSEYDNVRDSIIAEMKKEINPFTEKLVFKEIYKKEEIYSGENLKYASDIVFILNDDVGVSLAQTTDKIIEKGTGAFHDMEGIFFALGENIKCGENLREIEMVDIAPTILQLLGEKIPDYMEGRVIEEMFKNKVQIKYSDVDNSHKQKEQYFYSKEESQEIEGKLKELGYL